ncbi:MAG: hypothetical protein PF904_02220 [Kiritimatiellae bacterium]|jgi:hypothetical protein|nr:hypothetical protein [Kiritimatiellia bacterium]
MALAKINKEYVLRMAGVAFLMIAICVWSIYDGVVAWPQKNLEFAKVRQDLMSTNLTAKVWLVKTEVDGRSQLDLCFDKHALKTPSKLIKKIDEVKTPANLPSEMIEQYRMRERDSLKKIFEEDIYDKQALQGQFVMAAITALVALAVLFSFAGKIPKQFCADEAGLSGSGFGSEIINYADLESIDWKQWDKKGIVKLSVIGGAVYTLDAWHFVGISEVVDEIVKQRPSLARRLVDKRDKEAASG